MLLFKEVIMQINVRQIKQGNRTIFEADISQIIPGRSVRVEGDQSANKAFMFEMLRSRIGQEIAANLNLTLV